MCFGFSSFALVFGFKFVIWVFLELTIWGIGDLCDILFTSFSWRFEVFSSYFSGSGLGICYGFFLFIFLLLFDIFQLGVVYLTVYGTVANHLVLVTVVF